MPSQTKKNTKKKDTEKNFLPFPVDEVAVGHAGLYHNPPEEEETVVDKDEGEDTVDDVVADIPLGMNTGGNTVINSETGVKAFVKDELAGNKDNHLPNTETGVWVHYLTKGIERDFKRTWEQSPKSIRPKVEATKKDREQGKRVLTKKEKNALLAKLELNYYQEDISSGKITIDDALSNIKAAHEEKTKLEDSGYFLSPKKTEGLMLFNWEKSINTVHNDPSASKLYTSNKIKVIIPSLWDNFYSKDEIKRPLKLTTEVSKSVLLLPSVAHTMKSFNEMMFDIDGFDIPLDTTEKWDAYLNSMMGIVIKEIRKTNKILDYHLVQKRTMGDMKPRYLAIDTVSKKGNRHEVFITNKEKINDKPPMVLTLKGN